MLKIISILLIVSALISKSSLASEPIISIKTKTDIRLFTKSELLKRTDLKDFTISDAPAYPDQKINLKAVKVSSLFEGIKISHNAVVQFRAIDGFAAPISKDRILNESPDQSIAYIAIEPTSDKWPPLSLGKPSAGPFYLIWENPKLSNIGPEEWPFMLASFEIKSSLIGLYPQIFPKNTVPEDSPVQEGFRVFTKNCFACHTLNKTGPSQIGPDLNFPLNPTEYFSEQNLRKLIRDPQSIRNWPKSKMSGFSDEFLSNTELNNLIEYLKHMAKIKSTS
ncbi:MAG: cytochrome c family protein [Oligoflexales bacterium]